MIKKLKQTSVEKWNQWFAGVTDGDGTFYINKKEQSISYEITTHTSDIRILCSIKNTLKSGTIKPRSGSNSVRYRVKNLATIIDIVTRLNGRLYHKGRLNQFKQVCSLLNIPFLPSPPLIDPTNAYLSGLVDSDGTISISTSSSNFPISQKLGVQGRILRLTHSKGKNKIYARITSTDSNLIAVISASYGFGKIYEEQINVNNKCKQKKYHWTLYSLEDFQTFYDYLKNNQLKSRKLHRLRLAFFYFKYKELKYHLRPNNIEFQIWSKFCKSWFKYAF